MERALGIGRHSAFGSLRRDKPCRLAARWHCEHADMDVGGPSRKKATYTGPFALHRQRVPVCYAPVGNPNNEDMSRDPVHTRTATAALLSLALASLPGCGDRSAEQARAASEGPQRTELPGGNPAFGRVTFLMQIHTVGAESDRVAQTVGRYQGAILQELLRLGPRYVFQEGLSQRVPPEEPNAAATAERIREIFTQPFSAELSPIQLRALAFEGAARVYAALRPRVMLLPTADAAFEEQIHPAIDAAQSGVVKDVLTMQVREWECAKTLSELLPLLNGESVCVIYGNAHNNLPALVKGPVVEVVRWPEQIDAWNAVDEISTAANPERQRALVKKASWVEVRDFPALLTDDIRAVALEKLEARHEQFPAGERELLQYLAPYCTTPGLQRQLSRHFEARSGPFTNFRPLEVASRIAEAPPARQLALIQAAPCVQAWTFPYLSEEGQMAAVWKLVPDGEEPGMKIDFDELIQSAMSDAVRRALEVRRAPLNLDSLRGHACIDDPKLGIGRMHAPSKLK